MRTTSGARKVLRSVEKSLGVRPPTRFSKTTTNRLANKSLTAKVATLSKVVKKLDTVSYDKVKLIMSGEADFSVVQPFYQYHLNRAMNTWSAIFGTSNTDIAEADKAMINSYKLDVRLTQSNEADRIFYSMFIVSLKDQAADSTTFGPGTGALTLADSTHYQTLGSEGRVLLNPKFFNIHHYKRFTMGGRAGDQSTPETRDISFTVVPPKNNNVIVNPRGNVFRNASFTFPKDPSQNYYLLLFNDDSGADLQTNKIWINGLCSASIPN